MARVKRLNIQGLSRKERGLLSALKPDPGNIVVSIDLLAGEPTVTSEFSKDRNYYNACFGMVDKAPYYDAQDVLQISDIYLMTMSVSPIGAKAMREAFNRAWPAGSFADQWLVDAEVIKAALKKMRQIHKVLALALSYGMQPKKMVRQMYENGYTLSLQEAQAFYDAYWRLFADVRRFGERLSRQVRSEGYVVNPFGYRLVPEPRNAFNAFIQSSVSGIIHVYTAKLFAAATYSRLLTVIHDELLVEIAKVDLERFRQDCQAATKSLNEDLGWTVEVRTGFVPGEDWFSAK